jgi:hypothetical protein
MAKYMEERLGYLLLASKEGGNYTYEGIFQIPDLYTNMLTLPCKLDQQI